MDIYGNKLVNMIETKPSCISLSNLAMVREMDPIDCGVKGEGHNGHIWN